MLETGWLSAFKHCLLPKKPGGVDTLISGQIIRLEDEQHHKHTWTWEDAAQIH